MLVVDEYLAVEIVLGDWPDRLPDDDMVVLPASRHFRLLQRIHQPGTGQLTGILEQLTPAGRDSLRSPHPEVLQIIGPPPTARRAGRHRRALPHRRATGHRDARRRGMRTALELLSYFVMHPDEPITRARLLEAVCAHSIGGTVTVHVRRLREKIDVDPANLVLIRNGLGRWLPVLLGGAVIDLRRQV